jgi:hypothetical protein
MLWSALVAMINKQIEPNLDIDSTSLGELWWNGSCD